MLSGVVIAAAEKMPEETYSFKPTPDVRSFGQLVGHLADSQYFFCALAAGETKPAGGVEKSKTSKAELVAALKEAVAYCSKTYAGMTDAKGSQLIFNLLIRGQHCLLILRKRLPVHCPCLIHARSHSAAGE